jgi:hypothetical protein
MSIMVNIFLVFLFILQIIAFYFIVLLYMKVSKFDDLKKKQQRLMDEMDDTIGAYLSELKDENDRLIERLTNLEKESTIKKPQENVKFQAAESKSKPFQQPIKPFHHAIRSYHEAAKTTIAFANETEVATGSDLERAIKLQAAGHSIEEIAKALQKGQTEIDLLLKFR